MSNVEHTAMLVRRVLAQTRARVLKGDTHYKDKLLSLFETHTEAIRKGKAAKPTEFGKLVKIQEAERFITDYQVCATRIPDQDLWAPSLAVHSACSPAHLASLPPMLVSPRAAMSVSPTRWEYAASSYPLTAHFTHTNAGFAEASAGERAARDASAHSSVGMASGGVVTEARTGSSAGSASASSQTTSKSSAEHSPPGSEPRAFRKPSN